MNTTYFLNCVAGNLFGSKTSPALPTAYYLGMSKSAPNIDGTGVSEPPTKAGYSRMRISTLSEPKNGEVTNESYISFDESTADWGKITHYVIYDSEEVGTGNLLMFDELPVARTVETATVMTVKSGSLKLSVKNPD